MLWSGIFSLICGMVMEANVMATITDIMSVMGSRNTKFQETIDMVNTNMKDMRLPEETQKEIRELVDKNSAEQQVTKKKSNLI